MVVVLSRDSIYSTLLNDCKDVCAARRIHCLLILLGSSHGDGDGDGDDGVAARGGVVHKDRCAAPPLPDLLIRSLASFPGHGSSASACCLLEAGLVFCTALHPNLYTWHAIISAHVTLGQDRHALSLYATMLDRHRDQARLQPDKVLLLCVAQACANAAAFRHGCAAHMQALGWGFDAHPPLQNALIHMYANCGSIADARKVFDAFGPKIADDDAVPWSTMISAYVHHGHALDAVHLYCRLHFQGVRPDRVTLLCILKAIARGGFVSMGKMIHHEIVARQHEVDAAIGSAIVHMYAKCGCMEDAQAAFDRLRTRNVVTWNTMIAGHASHGHGYSALELYTRMQQQDRLQPEKVTFLCTLKACGAMCVVEQGRLIHDKLIRNGFERDCELRNALIDMYSKCRSMNEARNVFDRIVHVQEVVAWNSLIGGYSLQGQSEHVLGLFRLMQKEGTIPDKVTCAYTLKACASMEALDDGRLVHEEAVKTGIEMDVVVGSTIVDMYCKCKSLKDGRKIFEGMRGRNLVSWNAIIAGHVQQHGDDHSTAALELFEQMQLQGVEPNHVTLSCILKACSKLGDINSSRVIHDRIVRSGAGIDAILVCTVVDVYSKCGSLKEARWAFDRLPDRNAAAWAALIAGYADHGHTLHSLQLFQQMQEEGLKPDKVTYLCVLNAVSLLEAVEDGNLIHDRIVRDSLDRDIVIGNTLIDMYAKCNKLGDARRVFDGLPWWDIVSWGAIITGCVHCGDGAAALELYEEMEMVGEKPEKSTYLCILRACGSVGALEEGNVVHEKIVRQCLDSDPVISNTLVDMYAKCGEIKDAEKVFRGLCCKDVVSWNAVLAGHALHGNYGVVRQYLQDMESYGLNPDDRTYTSILASCGHAGALQECLDFFNAMDGVDPCLEHFNCVIDVFARFGCLTDAEEILQSIPSSPDSTSWVSLLSSCKVHGDPRTGGQCFDQVLLEA